MCKQHKSENNKINIIIYKYKHFPNTSAKQNKHTYYIHIIINTNILKHSTPNLQIRI